MAATATTPINMVARSFFIVLNPFFDLFTLAVDRPFPWNLVFKLNTKKSFDLAIYPSPFLLSCL
jgi:hypothetical protein